MPAARTFEVGGEVLTAREVAERYRVSARTFLQRVGKLGWDLGRAIREPVSPKGRRGGRRREGAPRPCPALKEHPSGRAYVRWKMRGRTHERYFGRWDSPEAVAGYRRFAAEWAAGAYERLTKEEAAGLGVGELIFAWLTHCDREYRKDGRRTSEYTQCAAACRFLNDLYGDTRAAEFEPAHLRAVREVMVAKKLTRHTCNAYTSRLVRMFGWAVGHSLIPPHVHGALAQVEHLKAGRTAAPDRERRKPATDEQVAAAIPHLSPREDRRAKLAAMIQLQRLAGMRPGEVCALRPCELDRGGEVWRYAVGAANKNRHRGKAQVYYLGPKAVAILAPFLAGAPADRPVFGIGPRAYGEAVRVACVKAGVSIWTPHQLRHALATAVAERFRSMDHAAAAIGDTAAVAAGVYVHIDPKEQAKIEVARAMG